MTKGQRLKYKRELLGISQTDMASKIGVSKQTLYKYENDIVSNIPSDKIELLAKALEVTPEYIMGWETESHSTMTADNASVLAKATLDPLVLDCVRMLTQMSEAQKQQAKSYINYLLSEDH